LNRAIFNPIRFITINCIQALLLIILCILTLLTTSCREEIRSTTLITPTVTSSSPKFNLNISITPDGGGSIKADPGISDLADGTTVKLIAVPSEGYLFDRWSGDVKGRETNVTININSNKNITASFKIDLDAIAREALTRAEAKTMLENDIHALAIDIRAFEDYQKGHLPGAISVPEKDLEWQYSKIPEGFKLLVYTGCG
jgi:hypothetical protein